MDSQSQSQKIKVCSACLRSLPASHFGILRSNPDQYNYCCKECRNYRRRLAYKPHLPENILPLDANNEMVLKQMMDQGEESILGLNLKTLATVKISISKKQDYRIFKIQGDQKIDLIFEHYEDHQINIVLNTLRQIRIRLFLFKDAGHISFWGGTFTIDKKDSTNY